MTFARPTCAEPDRAMPLWLPRLFIAAVLLFALAGPARAEHVANVRIDRSDTVYAVNPDQTYTETVTHRPHPADHPRHPVARPLGDVVLPRSADAGGAGGLGRPARRHARAGRAGEPLHPPLGGQPGRARLHRQPDHHRRLPAASPGQPHPCQIPPGADHPADAGLQRLVGGRAGRTRRWRTGMEIDLPADLGCNGAAAAR